MTFTRNNPGTKAAMANIARIQAMPPLMRESWEVKNPATRPDSNWPSIGPLISGMIVSDA